MTFLELKKKWYKREKQITLLRRLWKATGSFKLGDKNIHNLTLWKFF